MLTRDDILRGLRKIDAIALHAGVTIDLAVYGGAALAIVYDMRVTTRDVDAIVRGDPKFLRETAKAVADEEGWPEDWLNDGVKGYISGSEQVLPLEEFGGSEQGGLRLYVPTAEYLFAMKCMAMRAEGIDGSHDISDIEGLADAAAVPDVAAAIAIVESFYPSSRIPVKVRFGIEEIMERVIQRRSARAGELSPP